MPQFYSDGQTQWEIDPMTGLPVGSGARIPPRDAPRFRTTTPPEVLRAIQSFGGTSNPAAAALPVSHPNDLPGGLSPISFGNGATHMVNDGPFAGRSAGLANWELPEEPDPFAGPGRQVASSPLGAKGMGGEGVGVDMGPTAPSIPMGDLASRFRPGPQRLQFDASADSPEPADAPVERPIDMLREPSDGMQPVGLRAIPDASRTPTLKERMMIAQTRQALRGDQERAAGAGARANAMRRMPNQSSGFLDIDPTDPTKLLLERAQDTVNMDRADRAIRGEDMRDQNVDALWGSGGRKYPSLTMEELARYVAERKSKEGKQIGDLDVAGAKEKLKTRMANPKMERRSGPMEAKLQQQYKEKRDARQAKDAYGNAVKMTASSNPRRQRAGQALLDAIQSGPGGGGQDGSGMSANSIAREGMHAARAAAHAGVNEAGQRAVYESTVRAATNIQEAMRQQQRDKEKMTFDAQQNDLNRTNDLKRTEMMSEATKDKGTAKYDLLNTVAGRAAQIQSQNPTMTREDAYKRAQAEVAMESGSAAGGAIPMPGLPEDTGPLSLLEEERRIAAQKDAEQKTRSKAASDAAQAEREKRARLHGEWLRTLPVNGFRGGG